MKVRAEDCLCEDTLYTQVVTITVLCAVLKSSIEIIFYVADRQLLFGTDYAQLSHLIISEKGNAAITRAAAASTSPLTNPSRMANR